MTMTNQSESNANTIQPSAPAAAIADAAGSAEGLTPRPRRKRSRRGSIIVLALGVLAILAIAAVSYVAVVRVDRSSVVASQRVIRIQPQVNTVTNEIGAILTADLFGNKIVTRDTPAKIWPGAFEDGDTIDMPRIDQAWSNTNDPTNVNNIMNITPGVAALGFPEDAWLASTEPVIDLNNFNLSYWPNITNLRSAWRYEPRSGSRAERWVRGDGQYLDLMQFFFQTNASGNANPAADLSNANALKPELGAAYVTSDNNQRARMQVFGRQMNRVDNALSPINSVSNDQERFWADTDGDLRPDARWQRIDSLGNAFGLNWVVAARIIDASSLVNFNTATTFPYQAFVQTALPPNRNAAHVVGTGETPADVDLLRLIGYSAPNTGANTLADTFLLELNGAGTIWPVGVRTDRLMDDTQNPMYRELLANAMGFGTTIRNLSAPPVPANNPNYNPPYEPRLNSSPTRYPGEAFAGLTGGWAAGDYPTAAQRAVWYTLLTADPTVNPAPRSVTPITTRDFADLHAFRGTNNTTVTGKLEQYLDGPEAGGYLSGTNNAPYGPLRSREGTEGTNNAVAESPRFFGDPNPNSGSAAGRPTITQLAWDNRHLLTPVSGTGNISPVPVLNTPAYTGQTVPAQKSYFDGRSSLERINLPELETTLNTKGPDRDTAQRIFDAFVWAIAPLATDRPQSRELASANLTATTGDNLNRHYGGTANGPANKLATDAAIGQMNSGFAVLKALGLTVNLMDALDSSSATGSLLSEAPTAVRFINDSTRALTGTASGITSGGAPVIGTRLAQGNIPQLSLPDKIFGTPAAGGVTAIGIDRQPFLVQASYYAMYEDSDAVPNGQATATIEPQSAGPGFKDQMGSIMAFELRNPWPQTIDLANYKILVRNAAAGTGINLEFDLGQAESVSTLALAPGAAAVCYYRLGNANAPTEMQTFWDNANDPFGGGAGESVVSRFEELCVATGGSPAIVRLTAGAITASVDGSSGNPPVVTPSSGLPPVFADFLLGGTGSVAQSKIIPVLLVRKAGGNVTFDTVVDRLSPPATGGEEFPKVQTADYAVAFPQVTVGPSLVQSQGRLRIMVASTLHRPTGNPANKGFPAYIAERREANKAQALPLLAQGPYVVGGTVTNQRRQEWIIGPSPVPPDPVPTANEMVLSVEGAIGPGSDPTWQSIGSKDKGFLTIAGTPYTGTLSLFNPTRHIKPVPEDTGTLDPNTPPPGPAIRSAADLLLVPTVATLYIHTDLGLPRIGEAADLSLSYTAGTDTLAFATTLGSGKGAWVTASEQLGSDWELFRNPVAGSANVNPYAGMLDPTQYVLSSQMTASDAANLPDAMTIPLALRVVDAFDGLQHAGDLAQGKINLNTAPPRVLACLPFLSPLTAINNVDDPVLPSFNGTASLPAPATNNPQEYPLLYNWLLPYRSLGLEGDPATTISTDPATRGTKTGIPEVRKRGTRAAEFGLTSVGELAALATWDPTNGTVATGGIDTTGFAHIGANTITEKSVPFGRIGKPEAHVYEDTTGTPSYRVTDGPEEKAALLRALANIATTRSDVFIATFVLRGYDPDVIESINVNGGGSVPSLTEARAAMNSEKFRPTVDTRWLVVYDRSNVKLPTDRPKVLLQMELPSAKP
jgi:hypothetical protein